MTVVCSKLKYKKTDLSKQDRSVFLYKDPITEKKRVTYVYFSLF